MLEMFPLTDVIRKVLTGSGECARVTWTLPRPVDARLGADRGRWGSVAFGAWRQLSAAAAR